MYRNRLFFLPAIPALLLVGEVADAGTLSSVTLEGSAGPVMDPGSIRYCSASSATSVNCLVSVSASGSDATYAAAGAQGQASSAFGNLSGEVLGGVDNEDAHYGEAAGLNQAQFAAQFSDPVLVTGGTGPGTLVAHFTWQGCDAAFWGDYCGALSGQSPMFSTTAGSSTESWTATGGSYSGASDVSTAFTFGGYTNIAGSIGGDMLNNGLEFCPYGGICSYESSASLTLTGFSVYDAAGNLVAGAQVTPILNPVSTPESNSLVLLLCGGLLLGRGRFANLCRRTRRI